MGQELGQTTGSSTCMESIGFNNSLDGNKGVSQQVTMSLSESGELDGREMKKHEAEREEPAQRN